MNMQVETARRERLKVHMLLAGVTNSGKTVSALLIAKGIIAEMYPDLQESAQWGLIGVIDTEHRRASLNAQKQVGETKIGEFHVVNMDAPYTVERYEGAFGLLARIGCQVIIVDSITHNWEGLGGILHKVDQSGGQFSAWGKVKPDLKRFQDLLVSSQMHVISTVRVKQDYVVVANEKGKMAPVKVGLKNITKDDLDYEYAIAFRLEADHIAYPVKDNSDIFTEPTHLTEEHGKKLYKWAEQGVDVAEEQRKQREEEEAMRQQFLAEIIEHMPNATVSQYVADMAFQMRVPLENFNVETMYHLNQKVKEIINNGNIHNGPQ
ncbi:AAA family ATPase [Listeria cornellensis]|uniref:AAA+ ATPase domain-containing protein n=1 Tax=Listeria cornellensis FSL F6-0969 TaxID=1265820 RepID=W7BN90_9LIST|nr:AAA family ATPase [Listeria cornellensis]EUJ27357.1 hypothetical protein PCORN_13547 [Listeria cornellensis FSL F6-0969]